MMEMSVNRTRIINIFNHEQLISIFFNKCNSSCIGINIVIKLYYPYTIFEKFF